MNEIFGVKPACAIIWVMLEPAKKRRRTKRSKKATCSVQVFLETCGEDIKFLHDNLAAALQSSNENTALRYASIYRLVSLGETLTFVRDDEELGYHKEWQNFLLYKVPPGDDLQTVMGFVKYRNELLHRQLYITDSNNKEKRIKEIFANAAEEEHGIETLRKLINEKQQDWNGENNSSATLSKTIGAKPKFQHTYETCIAVLELEFSNMNLIYATESQFDNYDRKGIILRLYQIFSDLQETGDFDNIFLKENNIVPSETTARIILQLENISRDRKILAHHKTYTDVAEEINRILSEFSPENTIALLRELKSYMAQYKAQQLSSITPTRYTAQTPQRTEITPSFQIKIRKKKKKKKKKEEKKQSTGLGKLAAYSSSEDE